VQDEAMSKLVVILAGMDGELARPLVAYLGLFRPQKRDLANDRALKLCQEVIGLTSDNQRLAAALAQTVEMIRSKGGGPLKNHNYLKRVLESVETSDMPACTKSQTAAQNRMSKTEQALMSIESVKDRYE
jgi:hypothetical protein